MDYTLEFGGFPQDVTVTASGEARVPDFKHLYEALCEEPRFEAGMLILLDLCEVDMSTIPRMDAGEIGSSLAELQDRCEGCALAVVARDPLTTALTRAAELDESADRVDVWIACSPGEALTWLESQLALRARPG
jgi:hypothetical protein